MSDRDSFVRSSAFENHLNDKQRRFKNKRDDNTASKPNLSNTRPKFLGSMHTDSGKKMF